MEQITKLDKTKFDQICRCCLTEIQKVDITVVNLSVLLYVLFSIEIRQDFPQNVCKVCADEIVRICEFRKKVFESNEILNVSASQKDDPNTAADQHKDEFFGQDDENVEIFKVEIANQENEGSDCYIQLEGDQLKELPSFITPEPVEEMVEEKPVVPKRKYERCGKLKVYNCSCGKNFNDYKVYIDHRKQIKHRRGGLHPCPYCKKELDKAQLRSHITKHTKEKPFICEICGAAYASDSNLRRHKFSHSKERRFVCEVCGKAFIYPNTLTQHLKTHANQDPFFCTSCYIGFKDKETFKEHRRTKHKRYRRELCKCEICGNVYNSQVALKSHLLRHGEKTVHCSVCNKSFYNKGALDSHFRVHTGERPYSCKICDKSFSHMNVLRAHESSHTGEKPYICEICSRAFAQLSHLKTHLGMHLGERAYSCSFCDKAYRRKENLVVHMRTHTGETPFKCDLCGKSCNSSFAMKRHQETHFEETVNLEDPKNEDSGETAVENFRFLE